MSNKHLLIDNAVAVNEFSNRERKILHDIDVKRGYTAAGSASYNHKDGTTVIMARHQSSVSKAGAWGLDIILIKGDDYLHFETIAEENQKNGKLNIIIGNFESNDQKKVSYPMEAILNSKEVENLLTNKLPNVASTFKKYMPEEFDEMLHAVGYFDKTKKQNSEAVFMAAFNKWNGGKGI